MQGLSDMSLNCTVRRFVITLFFLLQCTSVQAQQSILPNELRWHFGLELFQMLLEERGMTIMQSLESSLDSPSHSVIVVTGDLRRLPSDIGGRLVQFVRRGGNVLLASDQPRRMTGIVEIKAGPVVSTREDDRYLDFKDCIRILNINASHLSMRGVNEIVSNRTAWLALPTKTSTVDSLNWQVVASLPFDCLPSASSEQPLIVVGYSNEQNAGVMFVIADTSVLTNGMLWHGDNSTFAIRVSDLLGRGQKTHMSFVADGRVLSNYIDRIQPPTPKISSIRTNGESLPRIQDLPKSDLETKLLVANHVLKSIANSNILNEAMANQPRPVNARLYSIAVWVMISAAAVLLILVYTLRRIPTILKRQPIMPHVSALEMDSVSRQRSLQYGPAAFILAREFCKECSGTSGEKEWKNQATSFRHSGAIPNDKAFREKLEYVRSFEISNLVPKVSEREFLRLGKTIHELREALRPPKVGGAT